MRIDASRMQGADATERQKLARLTDGAHQFEAMMLQQMLKPLHFGQSPGAEAEDGGANASIQGFGTEALAKSIAGHGGFGIARQIIRQVTAEEANRKAKVL